ncbi:MAG: hypothetical protein AB1488_11785 [Nitrospirota bacterium]
MSIVICAFCRGKGKDPFNLLSELATCQVCGGTGEVEVSEPAIKCAYCLGTGVHPYGVRITCTVCNGKGMVMVRGETEVCGDCKGSGRAFESKLPCLICKGKGVIEMVLNS